MRPPLAPPLLSLVLQNTGAVQWSYRWHHHGAPQHMPLALHSICTGLHGMVHMALSLRIDASLEAKRIKDTRMHGTPSVLQQNRGRNTEHTFPNVSNIRLSIQSRTRTLSRLSIRAHQTRMPLTTLTPFHLWQHHQDCRTLQGPNNATCLDYLREEIRWLGQNYVWELEQSACFYSLVENGLS